MAAVAPVAEYNLQSIAALIGCYRSGVITPRRLVADLKQRIEASRHFNIWITVLDDEWLENFLERLEAGRIDDFPLYGVPFAIKDNIDLQGVPTTAACPAFTYIPDESAYAVGRLVDAGAIPLGKTNLDQFATGLVGTRSPYGATRNSVDPEYIAGGSSSGSAVATALQQVLFALGTDTAGSGRVPAALNGIFGVKPTRGLVSMTGVVPACRSLDTISVFAGNPADAEQVCRVIFAADAADPFHRTMPPAAPAAQRTFRYGVPRAVDLEFFGNGEYQALFNTALHGLAAAGGEAVEVDLSPFLAAARLLYDGPWLAERYLAVKTMLARDPDALLPVTRKIIDRGTAYSAADAFSSMYALQALKQQAGRELAKVDFIVTPTCGTTYRISEVEAEPESLNSNLGYYTNFMNLLDYSAVALPSGNTAAGLPFGITLFGPAFTDYALIEYAAWLQDPVAGNAGTAAPAPLPALADGGAADCMSLVVCGAHLSGLHLNHQLLDAGAELLSCTTTAPCYRLYDLLDGSGRPGLVRVSGNGAPIEVEVWSVPRQQVVEIICRVAAPLSIGNIVLNDGTQAKGFLCEPVATAGARDVTAFGGWKAYLDRR